MWPGEQMEDSGHVAELGESAENCLSMVLLDENVELKGDNRERRNKALTW